MCRCGSLTILLTVYIFYCTMCDENVLFMTCLWYRIFKINLDRKWMYIFSPLLLKSNKKKLCLLIIDSKWKVSVRPNTARCYQRWSEKSWFEVSIFFVIDTTVIKIQISENPPSPHPKKNVEKTSPK